MKRYSLLLLVTLMVVAHSVTALSEGSNNGPLKIFAEMLTMMDVEVQDEYDTPLESSDDVEKYAIVDGAIASYAFESETAKILSAEVNIVKDTYAGEKYSYVLLSFVGQFELTEEGLDPVMAKAAGLLKTNELETDSMTYVFEDRGAILTIMATAK